MKIMKNKKVQYKPLHHSHAVCYFILHGNIFFSFLFFFFNDTATTEIYTLSLHDALPICLFRHEPAVDLPAMAPSEHVARSEEHTSELQSRQYLVCRLLLEKKKKNIYKIKYNKIKKKKKKIEKKKKRKY